MRRLIKRQAAPQLRVVAQVSSVVSCNCWLARRLPVAFRQRAPAIGRTWARPSMRDAVEPAAAALAILFHQ
jgi:hypothetical protein